MAPRDAHCVLSSQSRRPFGRPKEAPGPVKTFESSFQIPPAVVPQPDSSHQVFRLAQTSELPSSPASQQRPRRGSERGQVAGRGASAGSSHGGRLPSVGAHDAASMAPASPSENRTRQANDVLPEAGPSKRRRASQGAAASALGHRQTQSTPIVPVSAAQPPGGNFPRSNSSTVLPSEMLPDSGGPLTGPRSWPRTLAQSSAGLPGQPSMLSPVSPTSPLAYRGGDRQTPSTSGSSGRGEFSPYGPPSSHWGDIPSTAALPFSPHTLYTRARAGSYEVPDLSPIQGTTWQYPTSAPQTPGSGSLRAPSLPPNSASPSPNLGMVGDFDDLPPGLTSPYEHSRTVSGVRAGHHRHHTQDGFDLAPLPSDQFPVNIMLTQNPVYAHPPGTSAAASRHPQVAFYGQQYPHGSISGMPPPPHPLMNRHGLPGEVAAPDLTGTETMCWPSSLFGEEDLVAFSSGIQDSNVTQQLMSMPTPHTAPGSSRSGYYPLPAPSSHLYTAPAGPSYPQAPTGLSYSPPAGHPYSSQGGAALYASQAAPSPYASQGGSSYPSQAGSSYSSQRRSSAH